MQIRDNYAIQTAQAKLRFLTYDQQELIRRCRLRYDEAYLYTRLLGSRYRICRRTGDMEYLSEGKWVDGNSFAEVMVLLDWLCDSREDRYITGNWVNLVNQNHAFHQDLQAGEDEDARAFSQTPEKLAAACRALGGLPCPGGDLSYTVELVDGLCIRLLLWHGDEEFPARLRFLWDENTTRYIRYETTWYALGLLLRKLRAYMK